MLLKIKKIDQNAVLPKYNLPDDAGMDLFALEDSTVLPSETKLIRTGIAIELPDNTEAQIRPRSGLALKHSITVLNSPGTIDHGYRGEIGVILINHSQISFDVKAKARIAQLVIKPVLHVDVIEVDGLSGTSRGEFGFGSSGL